MSWAVLQDDVSAFRAPRIGNAQTLEVLLGIAHETLIG